MKNSVGGRIGNDTRGEYRERGDSITSKNVGGPDPANYVC